jgi:hypothetical protein
MEWKMCLKKLVITLVDLRFQLQREMAVTLLSSTQQPLNDRSQKENSKGYKYKCQKPRTHPDKSELGSKTNIHCNQTKRNDERSDQTHGGGKDYFRLRWHN